MKNIDVEVSPNAEEFYLAFKKGWTKVVGHLIDFKELKFSAVPINNYIRVSEIESGAKLVDIAVPEEVESFEETLFFLEVVVSSRIFMILERVGIEKVKDQINTMKVDFVAKHGLKPIGQKVDTDWLKDDTSDVLH